MNLLDSENLSSLHQLVTLLSTVSEPLELFLQARSRLLKLVSSDFVLFFFHDPERNLYVAPKPYNKLTDLEKKVYESDPIIHEMHFSQQTQLRSFDEKPIIDSMVHELFVPVSTTDNIIGMLYFGKKSDRFYSYTEIQLAEIASAYFVPVIQNLNYLDKYRFEKKTAALWKNRYTNLLESIPLPAVILESDLGIINYANKKFIELIKTDQESISGKSIHDYFRNFELKGHQDASERKSIHIYNTETRHEILISSETKDSKGQSLILVLPETERKKNVLTEKIDSNSLNNQILCLDSINQALRSRKSLQVIVETAATQLYKVFGYDYFSFTLLDSVHHESICFDLASSEMAEKLDEHWILETIEDTDIGWVRSTKEYSPDETNIRLHSSRLPFTLPTHTSVLVIGEKQYYGNLAIGRLFDTPFARQEIEFLKMIATQIATAVEMQTFGKTDKSHPRDVLIIKDIASISQDLNIENVLDNLCQAVKQVCYADVCWIIDPETSIFDWLPTELNDIVVPGKVDKLLDSIKIKKTPVIFDTEETFIYLLGDPAKALKSTDFRPFALVPLYKSENVLAIFILLQWKQDYQITDFDRQMLVALSKHAQNTLDNSKKHNSIQNTVKRLDNLLGSVSHDLKTPIQSIKSYISLLMEEQKEKVGEREQFYFDRISSNISHMEKFLSELFELYRIGHTETDFQSCDLETIVHSVVDSLSGIIFKYNVQVNIRSLPEVACIPSGLKQVFTNLISNAVKAIKSLEQPQIEIGSQEEKQRFVIYVRDNGAGIKKELQEKIFEPFFKGNSNSGDVSTGIGLSIVKRIVELHNGNIWVESEPQKGSMFKFTIPKIK